MYAPDIHQCCFYSFSTKCILKNLLPYNGQHHHCIYRQDPQDYVVGNSTTAERERIHWTNKPKILLFGILFTQLQTQGWWRGIKIGCSPFTPILLEPISSVKLPSQRPSKIYLAVSCFFSQGPWRPILMKMRRVNMKQVYTSGLPK